MCGVQPVHALVGGPKRLGVWRVGWGCGEVGWEGGVPGLRDNDAVLVVHRAESGAALARGLAEILATPPRDPFAREVVAVPAKGVERWLAQRLSHHLGTASGDGICANVRFPWPSTLLDEALQEASPGHAAAVRRWAPASARWPLLEVVDRCAPREPWCRALGQYLGADGSDPGDPGDTSRSSGGSGSGSGDSGADKGRRLAVVSKLARLYDDYGQSRPEMLRAWADGRDELGDGITLDEDLRWQAELWRRLRTQLATPSPAELLEAACSRLRDQPALCALPERISVFGASRLSPARLAVLAALAEHRDVHLWLHHASPGLWAKVNGADATLRRREDRTRRALVNPLLSSLSHDVRELQQLLARHAPTATDVHHPGKPNPGTLLGWLKTDLAEDRRRDPAPPLQPDDRSVQVHACHGRTRQVEVLREVVVGLLAADASLEPRDVVVMCPDVETFAPIIAATFSLDAQDEASHPAAQLRVRLADRALRQTNALLAVLSQLLELGTARLTASQVLDLAGTPAVRQRFGFDDDEVERLTDWVVSAGVRWGLHRDHRRAWALGGVGQGTWRAGLDRLLLGVAMEDAFQTVGDVVPLDDVDSAGIDLAGRLAELVDRLDAAQSTLAGRHTAEEWMSALEEMVLGLAAPTPDATWQQLQLHGELADLAEAAAGSSALLGLADIRSLLEDTLSGRPTRASFRTGSLTVCTLVPMRSVPHRVVCLLGLDDGVFPRQSSRDGDDVLGRDPWVGERDPRSEDRQLLLDAICAAEEHLVITYTGADERTNAPVPPAVPLGELLDALDRTASAMGDRRVRDAVTTRHPLQPFDPRNFTPLKLCTPGPFSFDPLGLAGALAAAGPRARPPKFLTATLPERAAGDIALADLQRLLEHPARGFLRQRLQVAVTRAEEDPADDLPVELDGLQLWAVGERVLTERLAGLDPAACMALEASRGSLPPGRLGTTSLGKIGRIVDALVRASAAEREHAPESYDVQIDLPGGTTLAGAVGGVRGDVLLSLTYSTLAARHRLHAWVGLLALTVAHPGRQWRAVTIGRAGSGAQRSLLGPLTAVDATTALAQLVALYRAGLRWPLPVPVKTSHRYAAQRRRRMRVAGARTAAANEWVSAKYPGEAADAEHALVYGPDAALSILTDQAPAPDEGGPGWPTEETDRFGLLSRRLWTPLLEVERIERS